MRRGILATRQELAELAGRVPRKPFDTFYQLLRKRCAMILETPPATEASWRDLWGRGATAPALQAARIAQGRILDLLIAHHIDRNLAFRDRAVEELKGLIAWRSWVDPASGDLPADLCTAEAAIAAVIGLDWLWEDLGEPDRLRILQAIRHKAIAPYRLGVARGAFWYDCYHSWNAVVNGGCGLAALALGDDEPQAQDAFHQAISGLRHFLEALGREGGWDEGAGPWGAAMRAILLLGEACRRLLGDRRLLQARGMDATGLFPIYFTPNGRPAGFGQAAVPLYGALYLLVQAHGLRELTWWLDTYGYHKDVDTSSWASLGLAILLRPADAEAPRSPQLAPVKVFHEIGWAAMADAWPRPTFYAALKAGDLSAHGSRPDMNSLQLQVDGEMLLAAPGDDAAFRARTPQAADLTRPQTPLHNTLQVAESDHVIDAQGEVLEAQAERHYRWLAADAGEACGENVRFIRHVVMVVDPAGPRGQMLVVLDDLELGAPERVDLHWHAAGQVSLPEGKMSGTIQGARAGLHFAVASTFPAHLSAGGGGATLGEAAAAPAPLPAGRGALHFWGGAVGKACVVSVFSRQPLGKLELKRAAGGDVHVKAGDVQLHFKGRRKHLLLEQVIVK